MRRAWLFALVVLCLHPELIAGSNFSGHWIYDVSLSTLPPRGDRIIQHVGNTFTITRIWGSESSTGQYIVDGLEHTFLNDKSDRFRYIAHLTGNTLRIHGTLNERIFAIGRKG